MPRRDVRFCGSCEIVQILRSRAEEHPSGLAFTFVSDSASEARELTWSSLDLNARSLAVQLRRSRLADSPILLLFPAGLDFITAFFGCFYAGAVPVPLYPPRNEAGAERVRRIAEQTGARCVLTMASTLSRFRQVMERAGLENIEWLTTSEIAPDLAGEWEGDSSTGDSIALLQYTSGSTSFPKGVMVTHDNLAANCSFIQQAFDLNPEARLVTWLPPYHDMGLIAGTLVPVYVGYPAWIMSATSFLQKPIRWLKMISDVKGTVSGGPNFAYDFCVQRITDQQLETIDLSSWRIAVNGSEPIHPDTLDRFTNRFAQYGFRRGMFCPSYGLAETTLLAAGVRVQENVTTLTVACDSMEQDGVIQELNGTGGRSASLVSCGSGAPQHQIAIVNAVTHTRCPERQIGEIWLRGPSVASGYWDFPAESEATFQAHLRDTGEGPFLRTGDLGFLDRGELFITGRLKDLIVIRGRNHYPQDIERTAHASHVALQQQAGAAFTIAADGAEQLVIVQEVTRECNVSELDLNAVIRTMQIAISRSHDLSAYAICIVKPGAVPRTSSGKIKRHLCRRAFLDGALEPLVEWRAAGQGQSHSPMLAAAPGGDVDEVLRHLVSRVMRLPLAQIRSDAPLSTLGLDSLLGVELLFAIESTLGVKLPNETLTAEVTIAELCAVICAQTAPLGASLVSRNEPYSTSAYGRHVRPQYVDAMDALSLNVNYVWAFGDRMAYEREDGTRVEVLDMLGGYGATLFGHNHPELIEHARRSLAEATALHAQHSNRSASGNLARALSEKIKTYTGADYVGAFANTGAEAIEAAIKHSLLRHSKRGSAILSADARAFSVLAHQRRQLRLPLDISPKVLERLSLIPGSAVAQDVEALYRFLADYNERVVTLEPVFVALERSFHGKTLGALCLTWNTSYKGSANSTSGLHVEWINPAEPELLDEIVRRNIKHTYALAEDEAGELELIERPWCCIAAAFAEPVQGEGGIHVVSASFLTALRKHATRYGFALVLDEIQSGMGRCGTFLASQHAGVRGDCYCIGKSLGGGLAKVAVALIDKSHYQTEFSFIHTSTFAEDAYSSGLALKALEMLDRDQLSERCRASGEYLLSKLLEVKARHPSVINDVRGLGLMIGLELVESPGATHTLIDLLASQQLLGHVAAGYLLKAEGIRVGTTLSSLGTLRFEPSAYISREDLDACVVAVERLCTILERRNSARLVRHVVNPMVQSPDDSVTGWRDQLVPDLAEEPGGEPQVAFIGHVVNEADLVLWDPSLGEFTHAQLCLLLKKIQHIVKPFIRKKVLVRSANGQAVHLRVLSVASSSALIEEALRSGDTDPLIDQIIAAVRDAKASGCSVVGLGGFLSIVAQNGKSIPAADIAITTGNAYTVAMGIEAMREACRTRNADLGSACLGGVGAAGNICSTYLRLMAAQAPRLILAGRANSRPRLESVAATLYDDAWQRILTTPAEALEGLSKAIYQTRTVQDALERRDHIDFSGARLQAELEMECGPGRFIGITEDLASLRACHVIVSASNSSNPVLFPEHLGPHPTIICDISIPSDVSQSVLDQRPDVAVIRGGVVHLPANDGFQIEGMRLPPGHMLACMAETTLLGLEQVRHHFSFGAISKEEVEWILDAGKRHGYGLGYLTPDKPF